MHRYHRLSRGGTGMVYYLGRIALGGYASRRHFVLDRRRPGEASPRCEHSCSASAPRWRRCRIGIERSFLLEDAHSVASEKIQVWDDESIRMNDGGCDPDGRFYCGSMGYDQQPGVASLYRLDPDLSVHPVLGDVTISNGLEWSPDGT